MKMPKLASMSLDAMYSMRNSLEKAIAKQLKSARKGMAALPMMGDAKPKKKTKKAGARKSAAGRATGKRMSAKKAPVGRAAARKTTAKRTSRKS